MRWSKKVPTKPGIYLRKNPIASQVLRQDIYLSYSGELQTTNGEGGIGFLKDWGGAKFMWWYGPIPYPPKERERKDHGRR